MMKRVDVLVLNWNGWQDTLACLASLQLQGYPSFKLLVADNASTDGSVGSVGSVVYEADATARIQLWGGGRVQRRSRQSTRRRLPGQLDFMSSASVLLCRKAMAKVGFFDELTFFMCRKDTDRGSGLRQAGHHRPVSSRPGGCHGVS